MRTLVAPIFALALLAPTAARAESKAWTAAKQLIPGGVEVVGGVNGSNLRSSKLYDTMLPLAMMNASEAKVQLDQIKTDCGIDVLQSIDSVAFGLDANQKGVVVVALKGTNRKDLEACAQKRAKTEAKTLTITPAGKLTKYSGFAKDDVFLDWVSSDVVAMTTSPDDKDASAKLLAGGIAKDASVKHALAAVNTNAALWGVYNKPQDIEKNDFIADTVHAKLMFGSANIANGNIDANVHVVVSDAKAASATAASITKTLDDMKKAGKVPVAAESMIKGLSVKATDNEVVATDSFSQDDVFGLLGMMMRGK
jgi:hypothetical protein